MYAVSKPRRNGAHASCEPCRKSKVRCSHETPTCTRCRSKGLEDRCVYEARPLSKSKNLAMSRVSSVKAVQAVAAQSALNGVTSDVRTGSAIVTGGTRETWFSAEYGSNGLRETAMRGIICAIDHLQHVEREIDELYWASSASFLPPIMAKALYRYMRSSSTIRELQQATQVVGPTAAEEKVFLNTMNIIPLRPNLSVDDYALLLTDESLRVDTIGLIYIIAARGYHRRNHHSQEHMTTDNIRELVRGARLALLMARQVSSTVSDTMIWLAHELIQYSSEIERLPHCELWASFSDLTTDLLRLDLHRRAAYRTSLIPFFLAECRKRTLAAVFYMDKVFAVLCHAPPRLPKHYIEKNLLPLDLSDDEIFSNSESDRIKSKSNLDTYGWNQIAGYRPAAWFRIRNMIAGIREECIIIGSQSVSQAKADQLREVSAKLHAEWDLIPSHFREWEDNHHTLIQTLILLRKLRLSYLHIDLQIYDLLAKMGEVVVDELITIAAAVLDTTLKLISNYHAFRARPNDLLTVVLVYGIPSATILIADLTKRLDGMIAMDESRPKVSVIVKDLSTLFRHLQDQDLPNGQPWNQSLSELVEIFDNLIDSVSAQAASESRASPSVQRGEDVAPQLTLNGHGRHPRLHVSQTLDNTLDDAMVLQDVPGLSGQMTVSPEHWAWQLYGDIE